ncbi:Homogentisate phytyltransferase 1 protein [Thalictrum thalictroides]|uniref:Homogentisate phytyltransferase 1 protein n=1 Tax=Thalictrum thalictroides TaxID=46969 RepID=A0A7J6VIX6_THATH|nr:Homogentisate phytyltransferase 1 protein [Thalictrum thalictroides]
MCVILMNLYSVAINQLFDIELDKVNKPDLPLASGEMSIKTGATIAGFAFSMSIVMGLMIQSPPLMCAILIYFFATSAYSVNLPFLRWKKNAFLATIAIICMRGLGIPVGIFLHVQKYVLGKSICLTRSLTFATVFISIVMFVVGLLKDIPDLEGDKAHGMKNFAVLLGKERVFWYCTYLMIIAYGAAVVIGAKSTLMLSKLVTVLGYSTLALMVWLRAQSVDLSNDKSTSSYHFYVWKTQGTTDDKCCRSQTQGTTDDKCCRSQTQGTNAEGQPTCSDGPMG